MSDPRRCIFLSKAFGPANPVFFNVCSKPNRNGLPRHVFAVVLQGSGTGMLVPVRIQAAADWAVSDAFLRFDPQALNPLDALMKLVGRIEDAWQRVDRSAPRVLRCRKAFAIALACAIHAGAIDGESLEVPLAIALMREMCSVDGVIPFGDKPVFATGTLEESGEFGRIYFLEEKLDAFVREMGTGHTAILTKTQIDGLHGSSLLGKVEIIEANSLDDLLRMKAFRPGLKALAAPPHVTEVDNLLSLMRRSAAGVRFREALDMCDWLLPYVTSAPYRLQLLRTAGLMRLHRAQYGESIVLYQEAARLVHGAASLLGAEERAEMAASLASFYFDACETRRGLHTIEEQLNNLPLLSCAARTRILGARCQLLRQAGRWDDAVDSGEQAFQYACQGFASEACRDLNYLIHALLRRAASRPPAGRKADLARAAKLITESETSWMPRGRNGASHRIFCLHYGAELSRLRAKSHQPIPDEPDWGKKDWTHAAMFALLACARNPAHSPELRLEYASRLQSLAAVFQEKFGEVFLFRLFSIVYTLYHSALRSEDLSAGVADLLAWCREQEKWGAPGWRKHLAKWCKGAPVESARQEWIESLCDAIPFH